MGQIHSGSTSSLGLRKTLAKRLDQIPMRSGSGQHLAAAFVAIFVVVPMGWMMLDRTPPHVRSDGEIVPVSPRHCGLPDDTPQGLVAGSCVKVEWKIRRIRDCRPDGEFNVTRQLRSKL